MRASSKHELSSLIGPRPRDHPETNRSHVDPSAELEGQGDLLSRLIRGIHRVSICGTVVINVLTKAP